MGAFIALLAGVYRGVSARGEAVVIIGTGVGSCGGDDDAAVETAFGVGGGGAAKIGVAFVGARAGDRGAAVIEAGEVRVAGITAEEGITGVGALTGKGDTGGALTFGVLPAVHDAVAGIGAGTLHGDASLILADGVGEGTAADNGITLVGALANDRDAGIALTFGVFVAVNAVGAFIGSGAILCETGARCRADKMHLTCAVRVGGADVGAGTGDGGTGIVLTEGVVDGAAALCGGTGIRAGSGKNHAGCTLTLGVLETTDVRGAGIGAGAGDNDALVLCVTFVVELSTTTKNGVTGVGAGAGDDKTGGVVGIAFGMGFTADSLVTFICPRT